VDKERRVYRVLIVDDEQPVLDGMRHQLEALADVLVVAGTARSGREALVLAQDIKPDLVFMDVRMPGMSGIDVIRELKPALPDCMFYLLTAYERFDIAHEAFELGLAGYLLKPVTRERLLAVVQHALNRLEVEAQRHKRSAEAAECADIAREFVAEAFFHTLSGHALYEPETAKLRLQQLGRVLKIGSQPGCVTILQAPDIQTYKAELQSGLHRKLEILVSADPSCPDRLNIWMVPPAGFDQGFVRTLLETTWAQITNLPFERLGIGELTKLEDAAKSYERAYAEVKTPPERTDLQTVRLEREVLEALIQGHTQTMLQNLPELLARETDMLFLSRFFLHEAVVHAGIKPDFGLPFPLPSNQDEQPRIFTAWAANLSEKCKSARGTKLSQPVTRAINYVREHYGDALSLDEVASAAGVSPHYLSRVFSEETGEPFLEFLTRLRMDRARELLRQGMSIKETSLSVGYSDPNYFSRLFKKATGATPSNWVREGVAG